MLTVIDNAPLLVSALFANSTLANSSTSIFQSEELSVPVSKLPNCPWLYFTRGSIFTTNGCV